MYIYWFKALGPRVFPKIYQSWNQIGIHVTDIVLRTMARYFSTTKTSNKSENLLGYFPKIEFKLFHVTAIVRLFPELYIIAKYFPYLVWELPYYLRNLLFLVTYIVLLVPKTRKIWFKPFDNEIYFKTLAGQFGPAIHNKLHEIHCLVGKAFFSCSYVLNRREQVVLTRRRIGHSRFIHSYLFNNEERAECIPCNSNYSRKHIFIYWENVADIRHIFYNVNTLSDLLTYVADNTNLNLKRNKLTYMLKYK